MIGTGSPPEELATGEKIAEKVKTRARKLDLMERCSKN